MGDVIRYDPDYMRRRSGPYNRGYEGRRTRSERMAADRYGPDMAYERGYPRDYGYEQNYDYYRGYGGEDARMDYGGMRQIGFEYDRSRGNSYMRGPGKGGGEYDIARAPMIMGQGLTYEEAHEWVRSMKGSDGTKGGRWKFEEVEKLLKERGVKHNPIEVWAGMNALYSDLCEVAKKFGIKENEVNFWLDAAVAFWLEDKDAVEDKLTVYYDCIVE